MHLFAGTIVDDLHELSTNMMQGIPVKEQKDNTAQLMRDYYQVKKPSIIYPGSRMFTIKHQVMYIFLKNTYGIQ